ncbi:CAP domain-containing protein [Streptodolium elevatio]
MGNRSGAAGSSRGGRHKAGGSRHSRRRAGGHRRKPRRSGPFALVAALVVAAAVVVGVLNGSGGGGAGRDTAGDTPTSPRISATDASGDPAADPGRFAAGEDGARPVPGPDAGSGSAGPGPASTSSSGPPAASPPPSSAPSSPSPSASKPPTSAKPSTTAPSRPPSSTRPPSTAAPSGSKADQYASEVVRLANVERAKNGCGPLSEDPELKAAALGHSQDMAARDYFSHTGQDGRSAGDRITAAGYSWSTWGENIARGQQTPESVMEAWMNSPGHRANILNCSFKDLGVGVHIASGGPWWTQNFAASR